VRNRAYAVEQTLHLLGRPSTQNDIIGVAEGGDTVTHNVNATLGR
jgi:hypothetical protein